MAHVHSIHVRRPRTLVFLVSVLLLTPPLAFAADDHRVPESSRYGVVDDHILASPYATQRVRDAGFGWVHYQLYWNFANPTHVDCNGDGAVDGRDDCNYDWSRSDEAIRRIAERGLNIYVRIVEPPTWTTGATRDNSLILYCLDTSKPQNVRIDDDGNCRNPERRPGYGTPQDQDRSRDFRLFVEMAVRRYKDRVRAWGFGTEIHSRVFWQGTWEQFFDEILRPGYETVKAIDPTLIVVGPDEDQIEERPAIGDQPRAIGALEYLVHLETVKGVQVFDVLSFHFLAQTYRGGVADLDARLRPLIETVRKGRPFWLTEFGYASANDQDIYAAAWLAEMIAAVAERPWIDKTFVYRLKDAGAVDCGLLNEDDTPKQQFVAVASFLASQSLPRSYYLAEGSTKTIFEMDIAIANPNPQSAPVKISFLRPDGSPVLVAHTLAPFTRETFNVDGIPGLRESDVSTVVESTTGVPLAVERTMFWDARSYGGHTDTAVQAPARTWYFAEGAQGFFDTYLLLANSNISPAALTVTFLLEGGDPLEVTLEIGANTRVTICACDFPPLQNQAFGIAVASDQAIIAERAMYFGSSPGRQWDAGHASAGVTAASTSWFLAEGRTGHFFDEYVLVSNPNDADATVHIDFLTNTGDVVPFSAGPAANGVIPAKSRYTIPVDAIRGLEDAAVSTSVSSDLPVVVERAMYWPGLFTEWYEAHNSFGLTETGTRWALGEGRSRTPRGFQTFILLVNTTDVPADVRVTYLLQQTADSFSVNTTVPAKSRADVTDALADPRLANREFGVLIESSQPIAVERAMYWGANGQRTWEGGSNAPGVKLP